MQECQLALHFASGGSMILTRLSALGALLALGQTALAQQMEDYTPLQREKWIQQEQPLKLKVYGGGSYDSNLFRLSDDVDAQAVIGESERSDIIYQLGAGARYDLRVSRQKFIAEANVTAYKFQRFDNLDHTADDLRGEWQWQAGNDWNGELGVGQRRYLESFANFQQNVRDIVNENRLFGSANYSPHSRVKLTLAGDWYDTEHGEESRNALDSKINNTTFRANWLTPAENTVGLQYRTTNASFPNPASFGPTLIDNDYTEKEYALFVLWTPTGLSDIFARIGRTERNFDQDSNRDYSSPTWRLTYRWRPTGKLDWEFATWRELADFQDLTANYVRVTGVSVSPTWSVTPKVALRGRIARLNRDYLGAPTALDQREDKDLLYQISALWTPLRLTELNFTIETGRRSSNQTFADYDYHATSLLLTRYF